MIRIAAVLAAIAATATPTTANEAHDILQAMAPEERNTMFSRYMSANGERCEVVDNFFQGLSKGVAIWNIRCSGGAAYVFSIKEDSSVGLLDCGVLQAVGGGTCFVSYD